jgi:hypothetical protein
MFCKNIKGVLFILIFFQADEGKMIYFYKESDTSQTSTSRQTRRVGIYKGGPEGF